MIHVCQWPFGVAAILWTVLMLSSTADAQSKASDSGAAPKGEAHAGYLFAHMVQGDYGRLYYALSSDGLHWRTVNSGKRVLGAEYWGHPDICRGHDGRYYLIGNLPH
jgi:hypothetical protein